MPNNQKSRVIKEHFIKMAANRVKQVSIEFGVWEPESGVIYTATYREGCNDHINAALMDDDLKETAKKWRIVEISYVTPQPIKEQS